MVGSSLGSKKLWQSSHYVAILSAALLFFAGFICVLLWTNDIVHTDTSVGSSNISTFTYLSPAVSTFSLTYDVAIFGTAWNSILFVTLLVLERDALPISTERLRYEMEKAACMVAFAGNAIYSLACLALMVTLAQLAANASSKPTNPDDAGSRLVASSAGARRAGQGVVAAMAGFAGAAAALACLMDWQHAKNSRHRRIIKEEPLGEAVKQA